MLALFTVYAALTRSLDPFHVVPAAISGGLLVAAPLLAVAGLPLVWCVLVLALAPWVTVLGYETRGHVHTDEVLATL